MAERVPPPSVTSSPRTRSGEWCWCVGVFGSLGTALVRVKVCPMDRVWVCESLGTDLVRVWLCPIGRDTGAECGDNLGVPYVIRAGGCRGVWVPGTLLNIVFLLVRDCISETNDLYR